jgi:hypothetical protein
MFARQKRVWASTTSFPRHISGHDLQELVICANPKFRKSTTDITTEQIALGKGRLTSPTMLFKQRIFRSVINTWDTLITLWTFGSFWTRLTRCNNGIPSWLIRTHYESLTESAFW